MISNLQSAATFPTAGAGPQPCKVEANKGARFQPCKVQEQVELRVQDFNLAKLKQTRASKNKKLVRKHQEVQLQLQDLNFAKLKKTTISSIQRTNEPVSDQQLVNQ
jgi:hypothetical protein